MPRSAQAPLFAGAPKKNYPPKRASLASFEKFHRANPMVYKMIVTKARLAKQNGFPRYSIKTIWEVLRWETTMMVKGDFKLNNNHHAYYARLIMAEEPDLKGFFELRERKR